MESYEGDMSKIWVDAVPQAGSDTWIRHVTVRQLLEATQAHASSLFKTDGKELKKFIVVANLCFLDRRPTFTDFGLDDGTGRIKARRWNDNSDSPDDMFEVHDFPYLRIVGDLEQFKGKNTIKVMDARRVSSPYEPYYHILSTICDSLTYERGYPPSVRENRDLPSHARDGTYAEEPDLPLGHNALVPGSPQLDSVVRPTPATARGDTRADLVSQLTDAQAYKGKAPMPSQDLPIAMPSTSASLSFSPIHHQRVEDVGLPEHSTVPEHDTPIRPCNGYRDTASEVPYGSPPSSLIPARTRLSIPNDPYSKLTSLQRDVLLCIQHAVPNPTSSLYPTSEQDPPWNGIHVLHIVKSVTHQRPVTLPEFMDCIEGLLEGGYIFNTVDEEHYSCT